ncbi:MAG TPA: ABC transporter substrate-binding protein [Bacteroidota bacterium]|nr:ABC transporter substrate-binding protein [Bacteroidota bacterium]
MKLHVPLSLKILVVGLVTLLGVLALSSIGCNSGGGSSDEILIGEYSSLTGTTATFGTSTHNGLLLAVEEVNNGGGINGKKIKLLTEDDQSKPEEAATAVTKLINRDRVKAVIGEVSSSRSLAAGPICQSNGVPMISPSSTNPKVTQIGDYIFRVCFLDPFQGEVIAKFAYNTLKVKKVAILKDVKNEYSIGLAEFFSTNFKAMGGEVIGEQAYSEGDNDFKAQLTALKGMNPEAVIVPGYYTEAALVVKQARELKLDVPFIGGDGWDSAKLLEIGGAAMENTYYANHYTTSDPNPVVQNFVSKYRAAHNQTPDALAALAYDAGRIMFDAIKRAGSTDGPKVRDAISQTTDFSGVTGTISIDKERNAHKSAVIIAIQNGQLALKERIAPSSPAQ